MTDSFCTAHYLYLGTPPLAGDRNGSFSLLFLASAKNILTFENGHFELIEVTYIGEYLV